MARLTQICLATLALMIAVTSAAPCGHDHGLQQQAETDVDVDHHTGHPTDDIEVEWEVESGDDELDGDEWEVEYEDDCHTECYEINDYDDIDDGHNGNGNGHHGNGNGDDGNGNHGNGNGNHGNGNHGNGNNGDDDSSVGVGGGDDSGDDALVGVSAGYIGTGDINAQNALTDVVGLNDAHIHDLVQGSNIL